jgi:hypothetical protein
MCIPQRRRPGISMLTMNMPGEVVFLRRDLHLINNTTSPFICQSAVEKAFTVIVLTQSCLNEVEVPRIFACRCKGTLLTLGNISFLAKF